MIATFMGTSSPALYRTPEIVLNLKHLGGKRLRPPAAILADRSVISAVIARLDRAIHDAAAAVLMAMSLECWMPRFRGA
jgi:hypothetical protein